MITENIIYRDNDLTVSTMESSSDNYVIRFFSEKDRRISLSPLDVIDLKAKITTAFPATKGRRIAVLVNEKVSKEGNL